MKLAVSSYSLLRWRTENGKTLEDTIDWVASEAGVDGIEFAGLDDKAKDSPARRAAQLKKRCDKRKLDVPSYCVGAELFVPAEQQKRVVADLKKHVDAAVEFGCKSMRHDVTRGFGDWSKDVKVGKTFDAVCNHIAPAIREVADYGAERGIKTSLENHGFYMQESKRVEQLLKTVKHPNFALTIDMGNFLCVNENPVDAVKRLAKYAVMAHVKDFHLKPKAQSPGTGWFNTPTPVALRGAMLGHGVVDVPAELKLLKKARYDWYLSLEFEGMEEPTKGVKLGLEYLKKQLAEVNGK